MCSEVFTAATVEFRDERLYELAIRYWIVSRGSDDQVIVQEIRDASEKPIEHVIEAAPVHAKSRIGCRPRKQVVTGLIRDGQHNFPTAGAQAARAQNRE